MSKYVITDTTLSNIADAIRAKTGKTDTITPEQMPTEIAGITTGVDVTLIDNIDIVPNFANGDQIVVAPEGYAVKGATILKPATLIPENIAEVVEIAGVVGTHAGGGGSSADVRYVTFRNESTGEEYKKAVAVGDDCVDVVAKGLWKKPTKASTAQYDYTFYGWGASDGGAADANILKNITADKTVYAIFTATARLYTITWLDEDGTELPGQKQWAYGTVPSYTPTKDGVAFGGWNPEPVPVTGNASYTVVWSSVLASGTFSGTSVNWTLMTNGTLTISGSGAIPKFKAYNYTSLPGIYYQNSPIYSYASQIKKVVIEDGVTSIGDYIFYKEYTAIKSVEIADSVTTIGSNAFKNCTSLAEVNIPYGVTSIGDSAFNDTALTKVDIPDSVTSLGNSPFGGTKITSITIPASITQFGTQCFTYNYDLMSVTLMDGLTTIGTEMFRGCSALTEINIPSSVATIGSSAFSGCTALTRATFENTSGWTAGSTALSATDLADPATAATYLTTTYRSEWTRT